jgi:hypothetical protein
MPSGDSDPRSMADDELSNVNTRETGELMVAGNLDADRLDSHLNAHG